MSEKKSKILLKQEENYLLNEYYIEVLENRKNLVKIPQPFVTITCMLMSFDELFLLKLTIVT